MSPPAPPAPRRLTLVTNPDECNLACPMCRDHSPLAPAPPPRPPRRLSAEDVDRLVAEAAALGVAEVIPSTRGEPLLWPGLPALAGACTRLGLALNVTTNGTFPGRGAAAWAACLVPACSDVKVSWNAATQATADAVAPGLDLARATEGLRALLRERDARRAAGGRASRVSLQVTARERNVAELPAIVGLAAALGVDRVKVNQLQVHFPELADEDLRRDRAARARWNAAVAGMRAAAATAPAGLALQNVAPWPEDDPAPPLRPCPFLGAEAWVDAGGAFLPCPAPAAQDGRLGDFGSVHGASLAALWAGDAYRALCAGYHAVASCAGCPFRRAGGW